LNKTLGELRQPIIDSQLTLLKQLPWQKDGCSLSYHTLLEYLSVSDILEWNPTLPSSCLMAMNDRGLASEVNFLFFFSQKLILFFFSKGKLSLLCIMS